jgi:hypothetical protein
MDRVGPNPSGSGYGPERLHYSLMHEVACAASGGRGSSQDYTDINQRAQFRLFLSRIQGAIDAAECDEAAAPSAQESAADIEMCRELLDSATVPSHLELPVLVWGQVVCWRPVDEAAFYEIDLAITYAGCDTDDRSIESGSMERSVTSPANRTWLQIPDHPDARFVAPDDVRTRIAALSGSGEEIASNSVQALGLTLASPVCR